VSKQRVENPVAAKIKGATRGGYEHVTPDFGEWT